MSEIQQFFNVTFPEMLAKNAAAAQEVGAVYLFKITGDGGGVWTANLRTPNCEPGDSGQAQCALEISASDAAQAVKNTALLMQFYFQGKLRVTGDPLLATKLSKVFALGL